MATKKEISPRKSQKDQLLFHANVLRHISDAVITIDLDFCITSWNLAAKAIYGWTERQVLGQNVHDILPTEYRQGGREEARLQLEFEGEWQGEVVQKHRNGTNIIIFSSVGWVNDPSGNRIGVVTVNRDISKQKKAEEALRKSERRFERVVRAMTDTIWDWDIQADTMWWSSGVYTLFGYPEHEVESDSDWWLENIHPDDRTWVQNSMLTLLESPRTHWEGEFRFRKADGTYAWVLDKCFVERDITGQAYRITGGMTDITDRREATLLLQKSEENFSKIFSANPAAQVITRKSDREILNVNESFLKLSGYSREELIGRTATTLGIFSEAQCSELYQQLDAHQGAVKNIEKTIQMADGQKRTVLLSAEPLYLSNEEHLIVTSIDITERKRAEQKLLKLKNELIKRERQFRGLVENSKDLFTVATPEGIHYVSNNVRQILGYTPKEYKNLTVNELSHPEDPPARWDDLQNPGDTVQLIFRCRHKNGDWRWMEGIATNLSHVRDIEGVLFTLRDITHKKQMEDVLRESEERFLKAFQFNPAGQAIIKLSNDQILNVNNTMAQIAGCTRESMIGQTLASLGIISTELIQSYQQTVAKGGDLRNFEHSYHTGAGELRYALTSIEPLELGGEACLLITGVDITDRKRAQAQLQHQANLLRNATDAIIGVDLNAQITSWNLAAERVYGWKHDEVIGKGVRKVLRTRFAPGALENIRKQLSQKGTINVEIIQHHRNGTPLTILSSVTWVYDTDGQRIGQVIVNRNITEQKRAEQERQAYEARFRALVDASAQIVWVTNAQGLIEEDSPSWRAFTGQTYEQWKGLGWLTAVHPDDRERVAAEWQVALKQETAVSTVYRLKNAAGEWRWTLVRAVPLRNEKVYGWIGMNSDITEEKNAKDALQKSEFRLNQLIESLPQLVWTCQSSGSCDFLSKQWVEYTGIPEAQHLGFGWLEQVHPDDREITFSAWNQAIENKTDFRAEFRIRRYDGQYRWFDTMATRLYDADGNLVKWFGSNTDIETKKQIELENKRVNEELDKFVYSASHDLRSPLVGVMGLIKIARDSIEYPDQIEDYLNKMEDCSQKLDITLQNILEYSYNSRFDINIESVEMKVLIDHCFSNLTDISGLEDIEKRIEVDQPAELHVDRYRLELIFKHLLKNAIQFRDVNKQQSFIHIEVRVRDDLMISIQDNGIGIKRECLPKVFDMFYRGSTYSRGAGLGLYITKEIVNKLSGKIKVKSRLGEGTTFTVIVPITKTMQPTIKEN